MTVGRIWRTFGLRPHRSETFKLSPDPLLIEKVRDIVGLYVNPPDHAVDSSPRPRRRERARRPRRGCEPVSGRHSQSSIGRSLKED